METLFLLIIASFISIAFFLFQISRKKRIEDNTIVPPDRPAPAPKVIRPTVAIADFIDDIIKETEIDMSAVPKKPVEKKGRFPISNELNEKWSHAEHIEEEKSETEKNGKKKRVKVVLKNNERDDATRLRNLLKNPQSMRDALILSEILNKPPYQNDDLD